jgi:hypothetical protein
MTKYLLVFAVLLVGIVFSFLHHTPDDPVRFATGTIVALEDLDDRGNRLITVEFADGSQVAIETTVPFFYKAGYTAYVAVHERYLFSDVLRIVSESETR